jgi:hypothetical protein
LKLNFIKHRTEELHLEIKKAAASSQKFYQSDHIILKKICDGFGKENDEKYFIMTNDEVSEYFCGGEIGEKYNNFQNKLFRIAKAYTENECKILK